MRVFEMWRSANQDQNDRGVWCSFKTKNGYSSTFFNAPPDSIDHVCINYIRGRFSNVRQESQMNFIKKRYKEEIVKFKN